MSDATDNRFYREPTGPAATAEQSDLRTLANQLHRIIDEEDCLDEHVTAAHVAELIVNVDNMLEDLAGRPTVDAYKKACDALELRRVALVKALGLAAATSFYDAVDQVASRPAIPADRPRVVCLCGSMRFEDEIREAAREESLFGHIVVLPLCNMKEPHPLWADEATAEALKANLDSLHKAKIDLADEIVVVSDASGYIGDSTKSEIAYAEAHGKPVRYWSTPVSGSDNGIEVK